MPYRHTILESKYFYHTYSRGINKQVIFQDENDYYHALELISYYSFSGKKIRYSRFRILPDQLKTRVLTNLKLSDKLIEIVAYCLMPNHFHFLLQQNQKNGISKFMADFQNSYTKYFNTKYHKFGPILQTPFKAELVENDNYLLHLSRYIHLNPYSSGVTRTIEDLENYTWSSLPEYLHKTTISLISPRILLSYFKNQEDFKEFVFSQADSQRELNFMKHLIIESE